MMSMKLVVVGDGGAGKTNLLFSYAKDGFFTDHIPTLFDTYSGKYRPIPMCTMSVIAAGPYQIV